MHVKDLISDSSMKMFILCNFKWS